MCSQLEGKCSEALGRVLSSKGKCSVLTTCSLRGGKAFNLIGRVIINLDLGNNFHLLGKLFNHAGNKLGVEFRKMFPHKG